MKRSPLRKRYIRDLRSDIGKYSVIFLLLMISISFTSGYIVAGDSMVHTYNQSFSDYNIEHGHFTAQNKLNMSGERAISDLGVNVYELFYAEKEVEGHGIIRIFADRDKVDLVCLMKGKMPSDDSEIAIDRMYADNNSLSVGDEITAGGNIYKITGLIALPDYSALFQDNDDMMFDASLFGTAIVTPDAFRAFDDISYCYAWKYQEYDPDQKEKDLADDFMKELNKLVKLEDYVPRYLNHAITFTGDDLGGDRAMMEIFLYIITVIIAFVYAITTKDTIEKESAVIGTLRAMGYTRSELMRHYMVMPMLITLISAVTGNIIGYTVFKGVCASLYYGSYSLTTYHTIWSARAFFRTTLIPVILMGVVTWLVLRTNLARSPLEFMRGNLRAGKRRKAMLLPVGMPFFSRFRFRIIQQNIPNYITLFLGILFSSVILLFGLMMPSVMDHQSETITGSMIAQHQYMLSVPAEASDENNMTSSLIEFLKYSEAVETGTEGAEKFSAYSLKTIPEGNAVSDEVTIYGIKEGSRYIHQDIGESEVYVSSLYQDKYGTEPGDRITLKEPYDDDEYTFTVSGIYDYEGALCLFMRDSSLNDTFDLPDSYFAGYFSDQEITDIDPEYIGTVIDRDALTKVSRQLKISMGGFMKLIDVFSVVLSMILIYLLSKIIIEKNSHSISMVKILGYSAGEIGRLYILATGIMAVISVAASLYLSKIIIEYLWRTIIVTRMSGWITVSYDNIIYAEMMVMMITAFMVVGALEIRKIRKIPMSDALKNAE